MSYFDCFVLGSWAFAFGWLFGAIYKQNRAEETEPSPVSEEAEPFPNIEVSELPALTVSEMSAD